jgi:hypothetical protein
MFQEPLLRLYSGNALERRPEFLNDFFGVLVMPTHGYSDPFMSTGRWSKAAEALFTAQDTTARD